MTMVSGDQHFGVAGGRHVLESCTRLCFARTSSCEARAPFWAF